MGVVTRTLLKMMWKRTKKTDDARIASLTPTPGIAEDTDIAYIDDGNIMHLLDVYYPEGAEGLLPVVFDIHGGGWMYGDKELNKYYCLYLASQGFAVVNLSYRLAPQADLKDMLQDVFAALSWLAQNGTDHHCDLSKVFVTGDSAGAHLTGMVACIQASEELQEVYGVAHSGIDIKAIAMTHGVYDFESLLGKSGFVLKTFFGEMQRMLFGAQLEKSAWYGKSTFVEVAAGLELPPIMLISSEADQLSPQTLRCAGYLNEQGVDFKLKFWTKKQGAELGHVFQVLHPEWPESIETNKEMLEFFRASI